MNLSRTASATKGDNTPASSQICGRSRAFDMRASKFSGSFLQGLSSSTCAHPHISMASASRTLSICSRGIGAMMRLRCTRSQAWWSERSDCNGGDKLAHRDRKSVTATVSSEGPMPAAPGPRWTERFGLTGSVTYAAPNPRPPMEVRAAAAPEPITRSCWKSAEPRLTAAAIMAAFRSAPAGGPATARDALSASLRPARG